MALAKAKRRLSHTPKPYFLHLGCGQIKYDGWLNLDSDTNASPDIVWNLSWGLPVENESCRLIYSEHVLEHLTVPDGLAVLKECRRALESGGILRIAMPSLDVLIEKSSGENWRDQDWLNWPSLQFIKTRAEMLNISFRWWGHQWLYDREELHRRLGEAGFTSIRDVEWGHSTESELSKRETRKDSLLICEAVK